MSAQLRTRKPTGRVPYPLVVIAGPEKTGKSYGGYALSASPRVGRTFVFDIGEAGADEYAELGPYEIVEHDGTYTDIVEQLEAACAIPSTDGRPNVIVVDSGTNLWDLLKDEAVKAAQKKGKADPTMDLWNKAKDRWRRVIDQLIRYQGIAVVTARAGEVAEVDADGRPVKGGSVWKIQAEKNLGYDANVIIRTTGPGQAEIIGARSLHLHVPAGRTLPVPGFTLDKVIFDMLKADGGIRDLKIISADMVPVRTAKGQLLDAYRAAGYEYDGQTKKGVAVDMAAKAWGNRGTNAISRTELDQLLASISSSTMPEQPYDGSGDDSAPFDVAEQQTSEGATAPEDVVEGPAGGDQLDTVSNADGPDTTTITAREAQQLHRDLGRTADKPGGYGLSASEDHEALIYNATKGRTTHARELTPHELGVVYMLADQVRDGRRTMDEVHDANRAHYEQTFAGQLAEQTAVAS